MSKSLIHTLMSLAATLIAAAIATPQAAAYATTGAQWPQPGGPGTPITLTYSYENMFDGALKMLGGQPLPANIIRKSIETALGLWASVVPINFVEVPDDGIPYYQPGSGQFGQLRFRHVYINGPDPPDPADPIAKAQAYFPYGDLYSGDVEFDDSDPWQVAGTLHTPDILGAATHEIGHTLGLGHTDVLGANMYWIFRRTKGLNDGLLLPDDIAGIRSLYSPGVPPRSGSVTPLANPEPASGLMALTATFAVLVTGRRRR